VVIMANSLLLFFACWEFMGLASYLLIGFWFHKPSAAAAAKKAFMVTRIGDLGLFLGMLWLYAPPGRCCSTTTASGLPGTAALGQLAGTFGGRGADGATGDRAAALRGGGGKSGQLPLHVWLPDAMEGPTPVSALIHAATMVAAGVFLVARVFPLMAGLAVESPFRCSGTGDAAAGAQQVVAWVGALTAVFAA
jgi:NADH-quinone oxidoreductase subunit L